VVYLPKDFEVTDVPEIVGFVEAIGAADLVTADPNGRLVATLMPVLWDRRTWDPDGGGYGKLIMHMARANAHWQSILVGSQGLAIIHGPQAYISPSTYATKQEQGKVVPTWDYVSIQFAGSVEVTEDVEELRKIVTGLTDFHESRREEQWQVSDAPESYINAQLHGIVGISMQITEINAKAKLSQNRSLADRLGVAADLHASDRADDKEIAALIDRFLL
jgi:transcriptional regulator